MTQQVTPQATPQATLLADYQPPAFLVDHVDLSFELDPVKTRVTGVLKMRRNDKRHGSPALRLDGIDLALVSIALGDTPLKRDQYRLHSDGLTVTLALPTEKFTLTIVVDIAPSKNTSLMGLYVSGGNFFTQCEAEGFRKIMYFPDRPDVMAKYAVTLIADKAQFPVLLSNGNLREKKTLDDGRHMARWVDPFAKPAYLFALVAGKLAKVEAKIKTGSGKQKLLQVYVEEKDLDQTAHAMESLKKSIAWDEERYGLELDLEQYMVVAVGDFNMGAMENKGLNIFNTKYVLAKPETATDADFDGIESVIAHEYFHNWTGNRVTCRDWFQLSLKEGLTVFRDQEFSMDMAGSPSAAATRRIGDVRVLRAAQFPEDAGPMAHPVRPEAYLEINNFYTVTIYEKGAEVVRMIQTLLGRAGFRKGMDLYFQRHDGQAVTCDDFAQAMRDANPEAFSNAEFMQFKRWYAQAGTPRLHAEGEYDAATQTYTLRLRQTARATPGQETKQPFLIPFSLGLVGPQGRDLPLRLVGEAQAGATTRTLWLTGSENVLVFEGIKVKPVPSLLRGFSAPVIVDFSYSDAELVFLFTHDNDPFNRWEAGQRLFTRTLLAMTASVRAKRALKADKTIIAAVQRVLADHALDAAFKAEALLLPSETVLAEQLEEIDHSAIHAAREYLIGSIAKSLRRELEASLRSLEVKAAAYSPTPGPAGKRALRNLLLGWLARLGDREAVILADKQYQAASNMTDRMGALAALMLIQAPVRDNHLRDFQTRFAGDALVMDKWFTLQAAAPHSTTLTQVQKLQSHPSFLPKNPNKLRALVGAFCNANPAQFHRADGAGYRFWSEQVVAIDAFNPQVAARLARALSAWHKFEPKRRALAKAALEAVAKTPQLSKDTFEVVSKTLT